MFCSTVEASSPATTGGGEWRLRHAGITFGRTSIMRIMLADLMKHRDRIEAKKDALIPDVRWDGRGEKVRFIDRDLESDLLPAAAATPHERATAP
jgi:hypothetical protein